MTVYLDKARLTGLTDTLIEVYNTMTFRNNGELKKDFGDGIEFLIELLQFEKGTLLELI